ncbi:synergin gamma [Parasteatoda tepidariorum]|uniref:synergin gamma n=1 Tax=Parasteatoda tepidariorum TaxID=114398 RepID=UPI00077FA062|nr:synergin gamma isoform X2 [Parasteatoda tepidariorum]
MSDLNRPLTGCPPTMPGGRMITPVTQTGVPSVAYPVHPNPYGLISAQPHPQFISHLAYNQLSNVQNRMSMVGAVPPTMPGMYIPVAQIPRAPVLASQMHASQMPAGTGVVTSAIDPSKLLEQQRKMEKDRNFQLQQQRLKQFTVAGKKGSMNADNLIDSMFGKSHAKETVQHSTSVKSNPDHSEIKKTIPTTTHQPLTEISSVPFENMFSTPMTASTFPAPMANPAGNSVIKQEKDKKELHAMMMECSNLSGPQKANKFFKPPVKEITPTTQSRSTFTTSDKARNWRDIKGLDEVFVEKRPRFPPWCCREKVPELYHKIESIVTGNGAHAPETSLLFPILVSSGLPQQSLAQIWEMVNQSAPGYLTIEEIYAALALIAVLQSGHSAKTIDILYHLPSGPVPRLQCFTSSDQAAGDVEKQPHQLSSDVVSLSSGPTATSDSLSYQAVRPTAISLKKDKIPRLDSPSTANNFTNSKLPSISSTGFISSPDDEFDDFKSATPTCVNFMMYPSSTSNSISQEDEFDDFKQAPVSAVVDSKKGIFETANPVVGMKPSVVKQDLMSPEEDKYSVFRLLQKPESTDDWADFSSNSLESTNNIPAPSLSITEKSSDVKTANVSDFNAFKDDGGFAFSANNIFNVEVAAKEEDDFGDFLSAEVKQDSSVTNITTELQKMSTNFADFSNFSDSISAVPALIVPGGNSQMNEEFGEFTSSFPASSRVELGQEFLFRHLKDNISLAESQSVSSLELGTFDGGGHSGESKSSLSRQGSIPSLDLKSSGLEVNESEDCFGDFQNAPVPNRVSTTPSPVKGIEGSNLSGISLSSNFQPSKIVPLTDKYSVIRSEEKKEEDQHISSWTRCLQSSVNILENTKKIFNQMSCSSVCNEVLSSEEGGNYVKDVIEVYKVACRIKFTSKSYSKQSVAILDLLKEVEQIWNSICGFFAGSSLMPQDSSFDFSSSLLRTDAADNVKACGLCLLNVEIKNKDDCSLKLSYGGRNYHSTCANFWVNCVDPLLPALTLPQLL